ncbi:MAG: glycosyltransferase, partial [Planctomycetota bacterium]
MNKLVKFAGEVDDKELPFYYNLADLFVLPSIHQGEAVGMVLLEAMASGVPI